MQKPEILVFCGIPCSGKSSIAQIYHDIYGYTVICRDDIRDMGWGKSYKHTQENEDRVTEIFNTNFDLATKLGNNIILDNTHCKEKYLQEWIRRKPTGYELRIYFFDCSLWKAYIRNIGRWFKNGKWIPFKVIYHMKKNYDKIDKKRYANTF